MTPTPAFTRAVAVMSAAASDLNDELTIIMNCAAIELDHADADARPNLVELRGAAQRCIWKAAGMANYAARRGARQRTAMAMERLILEDQ